MTESYLVDNVALVVSTWATIAQTNEVFQTIQIVLTCLCLAVTFAYRIWRWYVKAKEDGRITLEELNELAQLVDEHVKDTLDENTQTTSSTFDDESRR